MTAENALIRLGAVRLLPASMRPRPMTAENERAASRLNADWKLQ